MSQKIRGRVNPSSLVRKHLHPPDRRSCLTPEIIAEAFEDDEIIEPHQGTTSRVSYSYEGGGRADEGYTLR